MNDFIKAGTYTPIETPINVCSLLAYYVVCKVYVQ